VRDCAIGIRLVEKRERYICKKGIIKELGARDVNLNESAESVHNEQMGIVRHIKYISMHLKYILDPVERTIKETITVFRP